MLPIQTASSQGRRSASSQRSGSSQESASSQKLKATLFKLGHRQVCVNENTCHNKELKINIGAWFIISRLAVRNCQFRLLKRFLKYYHNQLTLHVVKAPDKTITIISWFLSNLQHNNYHHSLPTFHHNFYYQLTEFPHNHYYSP